MMFFANAIGRWLLASWDGTAMFDIVLYGVIAMFNARLTNIFYSNTSEQKLLPENNVIILLFH